MRKNISPVLFILFAAVLFVTNSCKKENDNPYVLNKNIYDIMKQYYLWYDKIPTVDPANYSTPEEFLDAVIYKPVDKWSFIIKYSEYQNYFVESKFYGHGFQMALDDVDNIRVAFIYKSSDMYKAGVRRGWIISKINGTYVNRDSKISDMLGANEAGVTNSFTFIKPDGSTITQSFTKQEIVMNQVLYCDTIHVAGKTVGYLFFKEFLGNNVKNELNDAFTFFNKTGINELILDLRYNGGGDVDVSRYLASLIGGSTTSGKVYLNMKYNNKNSNYDTTIYYTSESQAVHINRLFTITTYNTASASEAVINSLKAFMPVYLIGSKTDGKPVGMNGIELKIFDYIIFPITFSLTNAKDEGGYFNGLAVDKEIGDDLKHDFGDKNESCLNEAMHYIQYGSFNSTKSASQVIYYRPQLKGIQKLTGSY